MGNMTKQEYIEQCGMPELAKIDDSTFDSIISRFESTNNREQLRMLECVFLELKSHSKYSELALSVSREFEQKIEEFRVRPIAKVGDEKEWGTWKIDDVPEYYENESEIPTRVVGYYEIGNYAYTLGEMCIYKAEQQIDTIYDSIDIEIDNEVTRSIKKYEKIQRDFSRNGEEFLPTKMSIVEDVKKLVEDIEQQNLTYYRQLPKLTGMSRKEVDKYYSKLMRKQPRLANRISKESEVSTVGGTNNNLVVASVPIMGEPEEKIEPEEDDRDLLRRAIAEMEQHPEKKPKTSIYDPEDFAVEPEEDDRDLLKRAMAELQEKEQSSGAGFLETIQNQVVTDDKEYEKTYLIFMANKEPRKKRNINSNKEMFIKIMI